MKLYWTFDRDVLSVYATWDAIEPIFTVDDIETLDLADLARACGFALVPLEAKASKSCPVEALAARYDVEVLEYPASAWPFPTNANPATGNLIDMYIENSELPITEIVAEWVYRVGPGTTFNGHSVPTGDYDGVALGALVQKMVKPAVERELIEARIATRKAISGRR
jgi:hypothetical protein